MKRGSRILENNCIIEKIASNSFKVNKRNGDWLGTFPTLCLAKARANHTDDWAAYVMSDILYYGESV